MVEWPTFSKVILKVTTKISGKSVESRNNELNTAPRAREKPSASAVMRTKCTGSDCHRKHLLPQRKSGVHAGQCVWLGEGAGGRTPISHVWAVSDQQVCSVQESRRLGLYVCLAQEVSLKAPPGYNKGQQLHRHQLKMEIKLGSLHQDTLHPDHNTQGEVHWGLLDGLSEIRCF